MAKPKKKGVRRHLHIDPYIWMGEDVRKDAVLKWYDELPAGKRTAIVVELIASAVLGELGPQMQTAVQVGDTQAAVEAAKDLISDFVIDI